MKPSGPPVAISRRFIEITDHFGWTDTIDTHMTVRIPGEPKCFLINNYGDLFEEITMLRAW